MKRQEPQRHLTPPEVAKRLHVAEEKAVCQNGNREKNSPF